MDNQRLHELEGTRILQGGAIYHYTCNAPSQEVLDSYGISAVGHIYGRDSREVLIIPPIIFEEQGIPISQDEDVLTINAENLVRRLK